MPRWRKHRLALVFLVLAIASTVSLVLLATGKLRVDSEWPGLLAGLVILTVFLLATRR